MWFEQIQENGEPEISLTGRGIMPEDVSSFCKAVKKKAKW